MTTRVNRRKMLALIGAGAAAAVGPIAVGWQKLLTDASGLSEQRPLSNEQATAVPQLPSGAEVAPPAEEIVLIGTVDEVLGPDAFVGSSERFAGVTVDVSKANPVYPEGHVPRQGDDFHSRGRWLGSIGTSTFEVEFVSYNIRRIRGLLSTTGISDPEANYSTQDMATNESWQIVVRPENIDHLAIHATAPEPSEASLTFPDGTSADIIGYVVRPGVLVATFMEAHP